VLTARKRSGAVKGCMPLTPDQFGVVLALDKNTGVMKIELDDTNDFSSHGPQVFTTVTGWYATKIEE
jgi:hypothetical protein